MGEVHSLDKPEPRVWICACGCSSFELFSDGTVRCAACQGLHDNYVAGWLTRCGDRETAIDETETFSSVGGNGSMDFARRRIAQIAQDDSTVLLVVARRDGHVSTWAVADTDEQFDWVRERLSQAADLIARSTSED